jgi:hypothetical protein
MTTSSFLTPAPRPPKQSQNRITRALALLFGSRPGPVVRDTAELGREDQFTQLLNRLMPLLYERHWDDKQLWYDFSWDYLQHLARRVPALYPYSEISKETQQRIIEHLRLRGYTVEVGEPPVRPQLVRVTWRAAIYHNA